MLFEQKIQHLFNSLVTGEEDIINPENNRLGIYKDLIIFRFYEVLKNIYPLFKNEIGDDTFQSLIQKFIRSKPRSPYIWKMPDDFRRFCIIENTISNIPYLEDILWYEWSEVELLMANYSDFSEKTIVPFSWNQSLKISESARIKKLKYCVYTGELKTPGEFMVLVYYNFQNHKVYFQEITTFMFDLIHSMAGKSARAAFIETAQSLDLNFEKSRNILMNTLNEYCQKKILVQV
jgi:hypothetical protein